MFVMCVCQHMGSMRKREIVGEAMVEIELYCGNMGAQGSRGE